MESPRFVGRFLAMVTVVTMVLSGSNAACALSPYSSEVNLEGLYEVMIRPSSGGTFDAVPTVRVSGTVKNLGHFDAHFTTRRNKTWVAEVERNGVRVADPIVPVLLRGKVAVGGSVAAGRRVYASAASVIKKEFKVTIPGRITGSRRSRQRLYTLVVSLNGAGRVVARVTSVPSSGFHRGACGAAVGAPQSASIAHKDDAPSTIEPVSDGVPTLPAGEGSGGGVSAKVVTISTDADPEWYARYGDASNAVIASLINTAEAMYDKQLGIRFRIVKQHAYTGASPYSTTNAADLLEAFTGNDSNPENLGTGLGNFDDEVDVKHLFSGKDLDGSVIGIAYVATLCAAPAFTYGITQAYVDAANFAIFAHELGHNFGAFHDVSDRRGIMYPSISLPPADRFSAVSLQDIGEHFARDNSCISEEVVAPRAEDPEAPTASPTPSADDPADSVTRILVLRRRIGAQSAGVNRIFGRVAVRDGADRGGVNLELVVGSRVVAEAVTTEAGRFDFMVKFVAPRGQRVVAYIQTAGGAVTSKRFSVATVSSASTDRASRARKLQRR